jgi:IS30 family transposase
MPRNFLSDDERNQIMVLARRGRSAAEIARHLSRSISCIIHHAEVRGIELRCGRQSLSDDEVARIDELAGKGFGATAISRAIGRSANTVNRFARLAGICLRPPARSRSASLKFDESEYRALAYHAARKAVSVPKLCHAIVAQVVGGGRIDEVLNDG